MVSMWSSEEQYLPQFTPWSEFKSEGVQCPTKRDVLTTQLKYSYGLYLELSETGISECVWYSDGKSIEFK